MPLALFEGAIVQPTPGKSPDDPAPDPWPGQPPGPGPQQPLPERPPQPQDPVSPARPR